MLDGDTYNLCQVRVLEVTPANPEIADVLRDVSRGDLDAFALLVDLLAAEEIVFEDDA